MRNKILLAMLCGICAALALPPFFFLPLAIAAFSGLYFLLSKAENLKQAFWIGWSFGFAHHVVGLYWISDALLTDPARFGWMVPFAVSLIPAALAIYIGLMAALHHRTTRLYFAPYSILMFAALWTIAEWLRAHLFTGFPWNLIGYALNISDATMQAASIFGIYGLSFIVVLAATAPILLLQRKWVFPAAASLLLPLALTFFGIYRLDHASNEMTNIPLRLVQANILQYQKWDEQRQTQTFLKHLRLSEGAPKNAVIIWPETSIPYFLHEEPQIKEVLGKRLGPGQTLISGALRSRQIGEDTYDLWNSMEVVQQGKIVNFYTKNRLVPFGEYVPLRTVLPFVQKITHGGQDFARGDGAVALQVKPIPPFAPLICYEVIYPEYHPSAGQAQWLLNITNDAWFGLSSGPHQHFEMARLRAVEQGIPLVRAANTGISGIIDAYGRIIHKSELGTEATVDGFLPKPLPELTFFAQHGDWFFSLFVIVLLRIIYALVRIKKSINLS